MEHNKSDGVYVNRPGRCCPAQDTALVTSQQIEQGCREHADHLLMLPTVQQPGPSEEWLASSPWADSEQMNVS